MTAIDEIRQSDLLFDALARKFPGVAQADGKTTTFQFMQTASGADWTNGSDANAHAIANSTSIDLGRYFVPGNGFANAYKDLLLSIEPRNSQDNSEYVQATSEIDDLLKTKQSLVNSARAAYEGQFASSSKSSPSFDDWLADPFGGEAYKQQMTELERRIDRLDTVRTRIVESIEQPLALAREKVNPFSDTMIIGVAEGARRVPTVRITGDLRGDMTLWDSRRSGQYELDVTIDATQKPRFTQKLSKVTTTQPANVLLGVVSTEVASRIVADEHYKVRVTAVGVNSYGIVHGQWYEPSWLDPNMRITANSPFNNDSFFGQHGSLHLVPTTILVVYKPRIEWTVGNKVIKDGLTRMIGMEKPVLNVLGLRFPLPDMESEPQQLDAHKTTVTLEPADTRNAQVIGITSRVVWNGR